MSFSTGLLELMPSTVKLRTFVSVTTASSEEGYAIPVYATSTGFRARVTQKQELVKTNDGSEELATTVVWVAATSTFASMWQVTEGGVSLGNVLRDEAVRDEDGIHHNKIWLG